MEERTESQLAEAKKGQTEAESQLKADKIKARIKEKIDAQEQEHLKKTDEEQLEDNIDFFNKP